MDGWAIGSLATSCAAANFAPAFVVCQRSVLVNPTSSVHTSVSGTGAGQHAVNAHRLSLCQGRKEKKKGGRVEHVLTLRSHPSVHPSIQFLSPLRPCSESAGANPSRLRPGNRTHNLIAAWRRCSLTTATFIPWATGSKIRPKEQNRKNEQMDFFFSFFFFFWYCIIHSRHVSIMSVITSYLWTTTWPE